VLRTIGGFDHTNRYFAYFNNDPAVSSTHRPLIASRWGGPRQKLAWANTWLPRQLSHDGIDVFITFLDKELPLVPTRARIVSMIHDLIPLKFPHVVFRNRAHRLYYSALIRASIRRADVILTNSEYSRREIVSKLGVDPSKVRKITLGVERAPLADRAQIADALRRYELRLPFAIALGSTEPRKNNARVIEAVRRLRAYHPDLQLAIAGSNWRGRTFEPGLLDDRVRLLGYVSDDDLMLLMQSAEMLVFPSLHEGFGFPVIEAMALGVPVVTSNVTALPEVAEGAALLVNPNDVDDIAAAMKRILVDRDLAADLRARGAARANHFQWETTCAELVSVCESLANRHEWRREPVIL
jgi:glycosyltransferase involved in cell wall biosynthesis